MDAVSEISRTPVRERLRNITILHAVTLFADIYIDACLREGRGDRLHRRD